MPDVRAEPEALEHGEATDLGEPAGPRNGRPRRRRRIRVLVGAALAVGVLAVVALLTSLHSPMSIAEVQIQGASADLRPQVAAAVGAVPGDAFTSVDVGAATASIEAIEGITGADIAWAWWNMLRITVEEQSPTAVVATGDGFAVVDIAGSSIRAVPKRPAGLPLLQATTEEGRTAALTATQRIPEDMAAAVDVVMATGPNDVTVRLASGAEAVLGDATQIPEKFAVLKKLIPTGAEKIDVSVPERPAVQGLPPQPEE